MKRNEEKTIVEDVIFNITSGLNKTEFDSTPIKVEDLDLNRFDVIDASKISVINFRSKGDIRTIEGVPIQINFGNMVNGYEFSIPNLTISNTPNIWKNSESLYISGIYSENTPICIEAQTLLIDSNNGLKSKRIMRFQDNEYTRNLREDWEEFNVEWMKYVVWCKICTNENFRNLLLSTPENSLIVEDTSFQSGTKKLVWGAENLELKRVKLDKLKELKAHLTELGIPVRKKYKHQLYNLIHGSGSFSGVNKMGKILTILRSNLALGTTPDIDYNLLNDKGIYLFGQRLVFE